MDRRNFVKLGFFAGAGAAINNNLLAAEHHGDMKISSAIIEAEVTELQALMQAGKLTATALTESYLSRIKAIDKSGPHLNAIIELNPDALSIARELDLERKKSGPRGPLHGIPVLIKDNIATADRMQTTAGSLALLGAKAPRDAFLVKQLRKAGAIILGKTNLSEWANLRSSRSTSGWSGRGGLTKNPYALDRNCSGSSSGSAAAVAASLATLAVGTETDGSVVSPASLCSLVGIKPTLGLISRDGIVPIAHSQDTAGPMTRTVRDAAILLTALTGADERDSATTHTINTDYTQFLDKDGLKGARIGVVRNAMPGNLRQQAIVDQAMEVMKQQGAVLIDVEVPNISKYADSELEVLLFELKADLNKYLAEFGKGSAVATLADVIAFNEKNRAREMPYFDQELLIKAQEKGDLNSDAYLQALQNNHQYSRAEGIDQIMKEQRLDALFASTGAPAWITDYINGDHIVDTGFSTPAAVAGYPHITVPAGLFAGLPVGVSFVAGPYAEGMIIKLAYSYEQASKKRKVPTYLAHSLDGLPT
ncbi:amidase [Oxalobacteraceae bacterium GrIS 2.11]